VEAGQRGKGERRDEVHLVPDLGTAGGPVDLGLQGGQLHRPGSDPDLVHRHPPLDLRLGQNPEGHGGRTRVGR